MRVGVLVVAQNPSGIAIDCSVLTREYHLAMSCLLQVLDRTHVRMKVWERGAGPTLACGTGACAVVVAGVLTGRTERQCRVTLPGGDLIIHWDDRDNRVYMTGPASPVFSGVLDASLFHHMK